MHSNIPFIFLFSSSMVMSTLMACSSSNIMILWAALELNMMSFIPLMTSSKTNQETESATKYFLAQALGSSLILISSTPIMHNSEFLINHPMSLMLMTLGFSTKLGAAPTHFWFPSVMSDSNWPICILLSTWQKIIPLFMMATLILPNNLLMTLIISTSAIIGGWGGMNQTQLRPIMAYSSITHLAWILAASMFSPYLSIMYFLIYVLTSSLNMYILLKNKIYHTKQMMNQKNITTPTTLIILLSLLSLGGLPPMTGFAPKLMVLSSMIENSQPHLATILIIGSAMSLSYYLNLILNMFVTLKIPETAMKNSKEPTILWGPLITLTLIPIMTIMYAMIFFYKPQ